MADTLAQRIKRKYPGVYDDIPDAELERRVREKYPGAYDDIPSTPTATAAPKQEGDRYFGAQFAALRRGDTGMTSEEGARLRGVVGGGLGPFTMLADAPYQVGRLLGFEKPFGLSMPSSEAVQGLLSRLGVPTAQNARERMEQAVSGGMASAVGGLGLAGLLSKATAGSQVAEVGKAMLTAPAAQVASGATGGAAQQGAAEMGFGPVGQLVAGQAGAFLPAAPAVAAGLAMRGLRGGPETQPAAQLRLRTFEQAGAEPSVGQVTETRGAQALESTLSKTPGAAGRMAQAGAREQAAIGRKVEVLADSLSERRGPFVAGRVIEEGISGPAGFVKGFGVAQDFLYRKLDQWIKPEQPISLHNTLETLDDLTRGVRGAEKGTQGTVNPRILRLKEDIVADLNSQRYGMGTDGKILDAQGQPVAGRRASEVLGGARPASQVPIEGVYPWEAVKLIRSRIGELLSDPKLTADAPRAQLKRVYAALSEDMRNAVDGLANPQASKAMRRANNFTKAGHARIDGILEKVAGQGTAEQVYNYATNAEMKDGASKINAVLRSLTPGERDVVKSTFIERMGRATPGAQTAEGEAFSTDRFLTNWNKLDPAAKRVMFAGQDGQLRSDLDAIAKTSDIIKRGSKVFYNPSGTAAADAAIRTAQGATVGAAALVSGHWGVAATTFGTMAAMNGMARLMTNQRFVHWLANTPSVPNSALPAAINQLRQQMQNEPPEVRDKAKELADRLQKGGSGAQSAPAEE